MRRVLFLSIAVLILFTPKPVTAVPPDATQTPLIVMELYWARTAGGFGDPPTEDEWNVVLEGSDINFQDDRGFYFYLKVNASVLFEFDKWIEMSLYIDYSMGGQGANVSGLSYRVSGFQSEAMDDVGNTLTATACVNTSTDAFFYNRRILTINFGGQTPTTTETTTTTTTTTETETTTSPTTTAETTTTPPPTQTEAALPLSPELLGAGVLILAIVGAAAYSRRRPSTEKPSPIPMDAKVLIVCPFCGAKTEQGLFKCRNCGADL